MATAAKAAAKTAAKTPAKTAAKAPAAKAPAAKAAVKQNTVSLKQIAASLAETYDLPKKTSEAMLNDMVEMIGKHLKKGDRIRLAGLGILVVRKRAARTGRNPSTGESIKIKASKKIAFRPAKELKERI